GRIDHTLAGGDALDRIDERGDVEQAILEQISNVIGPVLEQGTNKVHLEMLGQDEDAALGHVSANSLRGAQPFVGVRRWQPNVHQRNIGALEAYNVDQRAG